MEISPRGIPLLLVKRQAIVIRAWIVDKLDLENEQSELSLSGTQLTVLVADNKTQSCQVKTAILENFYLSPLT